MLDKKYELVQDETKKHLGITLHRIRALKNIGNDHKGDLGGWLESESNLSHGETCWVETDAVVYGDAKVYGYAEVYGDAEVYEDAEVYGDARVFGNAWVYEDASVYGDANVYENARVYGDARVSGNAKVFGNSWVYGNARVYENALVSGNARISGDARIQKTADYLCISRVGFEKGTLTAFKTKDKTVIGVNRGCFEGTLEEFKEAVEETHKQGSPGVYEEYQLVIKLIETRLL